VGILLLVLGALALGSGAVKLRPRARAQIAVSWLTLGEVASGGVLIAGAALGLARIRPLAWLAVAVAGIVVAVAEVIHVRRLADQAAERDRSAERRFRRYLDRGDRGA
jgi:hypothetical protein